MRNYRQHYTLGLKDIFGTALICLCVLSFNHTVLGQEDAKRNYTLAEKNIRHARESLPGQIYTEDPELTRQVHNLYIDCLFDKLWEPALPGLPPKRFSITGAGDESYGKYQLQWDPMLVLNALENLVYAEAYPIGIDHYEVGTKVGWYKYERPNVVQDQL
jgi:hypothetical protein